MLDLTKPEKIILIFLTLTLAVGIVVVASQKSQPGITLEVESYQVPVLEPADKLIKSSISVNINSGQVDLLTRLPGVGETIAQRIVSYQQLNGAFTTKEQLLQIDGIGQKKFEQIKDLIVLE